MRYFMKSKLFVQLVLLSIFISCGKHINTTSQSEVTSPLEDSSSVNNSQGFFNEENLGTAQNNNSNEENEDDQEVLDSTTLNLLTKYKFINDIDELETEDSDPQGEQPKIDLATIINSIDLESLELVESGDEVNDLAPGDLFSINDNNTLCQTLGQGNGALSFQCQTVDLSELVNVRRPCYYKDKIYLHGAIIPVHPGVYRVTPNGSVITIQPGIFLLCQDGNLIPKSLPNRVY